MGALVPQSSPKSGVIVVSIKFRGTEFSVSVPGFIFLQLLTLLSGS